MTRHDFYSPAGMLRKAVARLKESWENTAADWQDESRNRFARDRLDPLLPEIQLALVEVQQFAELLREAERACADEQYSDDGELL